MFLAAAEDSKHVVLKVFGAPQRNQGLFDPKVADEASAYARLSHPNIVKVVDMFSAEGQFVIALEYVDGSALSLVRATLERAGRKVPDACWLYVMHGVFAALAEAHAAKDLEGKPAPVLHRGVNPSNVLLGWDGSVKLGNFNVAQSVRVLRDSNPGVTWGSYGYFAPEQVKLETPGPYSDVYSATLMLWELLAGRKAIERGEVPDAEALKAMASPNLPPLETLRPDLAAPVRYAVRAGLEPDPKRRIVEATRIRDVLRAAVNLDAARATLVEMLAPLRAAESLHETPTVAPPPMEVEAAPLPSVRRPPPPPKPEPKSEPPVEIISLMPDPVSDPPPPPALPPPAPVPQFAPEAPVTPIGIALDLPVDVEAEPPVSPRPRRRSRPARAITIAAVAVWIAAGCVFAAAIFVRKHASAAATKPVETHAVVTHTAAPPPPPVVSVAAPVETASAAPAPVASAAPPPVATQESSAAPSSDRGEIALPAWAVGHRVWVDHKPSGDYATPIDVACGKHTIRVGSHGKTKSIDVPCGGVGTLE